MDKLGLRVYDYVIRWYDEVRERNEFPNFEEKKKRTTNREGLTWGFETSSAFDGVENWNRPALEAGEDEDEVVGGIGGAAGRGPKIWE